MKMLKYDDIPSGDPEPECGMCRHWQPGEDTPGIGGCDRHRLWDDEHGSNGCDKWEGVQNIGWDELARIGREVMQRLANNPRVVVNRHGDGRFGVTFESE